MAAVFGSMTSLRDFQELIFNGKTDINRRPEQRWKGCDTLAGRHLAGTELTGGFIKELSIAAGQFHLPPNEIPQILPQQLLMLKVAADALKDAKLYLIQQGYANPYYWSAFILQGDWI